MTQDFDAASKEAVESVYTERNAVVLAFAALAQEKGWTVGVQYFGDDPLWPVLYVDMPQGQVSWHLPADEVPDGVATYSGTWDGHDTKRKYARLSKLVNQAWDKRERTPQQTR